MSNLTMGMTILDLKVHQEYIIHTFLDSLEVTTITNGQNVVDSNDFILDNISYWSTKPQN